MECLLTAHMVSILTSGISKSDQHVPQTLLVQRNLLKASILMKISSEIYSSTTKQGGMRYLTSYFSFLVMRDVLTKQIFIYVFSYNEYNNHEKPFYKYYCIIF